MSAPSDEAPPPQAARYPGSAHPELEPNEEIDRRDEEPDTISGITYVKDVGIQPAPDQPPSYAAPAEPSNNSKPPPPPSKTVTTDSLPDGAPAAPVRGEGAVPDPGAKMNIGAGPGSARGPNPVAAPNTVAPAIDLPTADGSMTVRLGDGAAESSPLLSKAQRTSNEGMTVDPSMAPKHDGSQEDPEAADREKREADMRAVLGEDPEGHLVDGIEDDVLYTLMRGFDRQINHVLSPAGNLPPNEPDLRMTSLPDVGYRSDTLKSNFERVFSAAGPQAVRGMSELIRLTDWDNLPLRTGAYCSVYFIAWWFGYAMVLLGVFATVLACFPNTRRYLFPRAPPPGKPVSATDPTNQAGDQSFVGSDRERSQAEQVEQQAFEARAIFEAYAQTVIIGGRGNKKHAGNSEVGHKTEAPVDSDDGTVRDEEGKVLARKEGANDASDAVQPNQEVVGGTKLVAKNQKAAEKAAALEAKRKRDALVAKMAKRTETGLGGVADFVEILQNTMSPPAPYPETYARFKFSAVAFIVPVLALHFIPARVFGRAASFGLGFALWGRPLAIKGIKMIPRMIPNLKVLLDPRNSILSGAPTNAQLMLFLFRAAEDIGDPLPPPPSAPGSDAQTKALEDTQPDEQAGDEDMELARKKEADGQKIGAARHKTRAKAKRTLTTAFRKVGKKVAAFRGDVAVDGQEKPIAGQFKSGLLHRKFGTSPDAYACKLNKKPGHLLVDGEAGRVAFVALTESAPAEAHVWDAEEVVELTKASVSVPRLLAGFVGGVSIDSLGLIMRFAGPPVPEGQADPNIVELTSVERRDPLFNRLVAIGPQRWEIL